jgi:hypothetical protein
MDAAFATKMVPSCRAKTAGTGSAKNIQAWAPLPDRDRSIATVTPDLLAASR